jgi:hypothetical protein
LAAAGTNNRIIFAGGVDDGQGIVSNKAEIFNTLTSSWFVSTISVARFNLCGAATDSIAIFAGGEDLLGNVKKHSRYIKHQYLYLDNRHIISSSKK